MQQELPLSKAFHLIEPGPVILVTTSDHGRPNAMTASCHMLLDFTPRIGCGMGDWDYSFEVLQRTKECVIAIPTVDLMVPVVDMGNCSGRDVDKFAAFGLTALPAAKVDAPLIAQCLAHIECRLVEVIEPYGIVVLEGVHAWIDPDRRERRTFHANGDGTFVMDGETVDLKERMTRWQDIL